MMSWMSWMLALALAGPAPDAAETDPPAPEPTPTRSRVAADAAEDVVASDVPSPDAPPEAASTDAAPPEAASTDAAPPDAAPTDTASPEPAPTEPAPPDAAPPPAKRPGDPAARGAYGGAPLPSPPPDDVPGPDRPWRGRLWFDLGFGVVSPVAGIRPGRGRVHSGAAAMTFGVRVTPWIGLTTGLTVLVHDIASRSFVTDTGEVFDEVDLGRLTMFDILGVRLLLPVARRLEPWAEVTGGVGPYRAPFAQQAMVAGGVRAGVGLDWWVAPSATLGIDLAYRMSAIEGTLGHALQPMLRFGLHR